MHFLFLNFISMSFFLRSHSILNSSQELKLSYFTALLFNTIVFSFHPVLGAISFYF